MCWLLTVASLQGFNGADLRNVCTEAGMFAIRADRDFVVQEDFMKVRAQLLPEIGVHLRPLYYLASGSLICYQLLGVSLGFDDD